jgi:hypothetical protein
MFDAITPAHVSLQDFILKNSEALQNAALLLGGHPAAKETARLIDEICGALALTRRLRERLIRLYELLTLKHVHDPSRPKAGFFALIDAAEPYVEENCLLSDGLHDQLAALGMVNEIALDALEKAA